MDPAPRVNPEGLQKELLLARCELDRRELEVEITAIRRRVHDRAQQMRRATPWLLVAASALGLMAATAPGKRRLSGLLLVASQFLLRSRDWWPLVTALMGRRSPGRGAAEAGPARPGPA